MVWVVVVLWWWLLSGHNARMANLNELVEDRDGTCARAVEHMPAACWLVVASIARTTGTLLYEYLYNVALQDSVLFFNCQTNSIGIAISKRCVTLSLIRGSARAWRLLAYRGDAGR